MNTLSSFLTRHVQTVNQYRVVAGSAEVSPWRLSLRRAGVECTMQPTVVQSIPSSESAQVRDIFMTSCARKSITHAEVSRSICHQLQGGGERASWLWAFGRSFGPSPLSSSAAFSQSQPSSVTHKQTRPVQNTKCPLPREISFAQDLQNLERAIDTCGNITLVILKRMRNERM